MARRKSTAKSSEDREPSFPADPPAPRAPRRRRKRLFGWGASILFLVAAAAFVAPWLLSVGAVRQAVCDYVASDIDGRVAVGSASLSWWSPVSLRDVTLDSSEDEGGESQPLLRVATIRTERSLFSLLMSPRDVGVVHVEQPEVFLTLDENTSNWEEALAELLAPSDDPSSGTVHAAIEVVDGRVEWTETATGRKGTFDGVQADVAFGDLASEPLTATLQGESIGPGEGPGKFQAEISWQPGEQPDDGAGKGTATVVTTGFPLDIAGPALRRVLGELHLRGTLDSDLHCEWNGSEQAKLDVSRLTAEDFEVTGLGLHPQEILRAKRVVAQGGLDLDGRYIRLRKLQVDSDVATFLGEGQIPFARLREQSSALGVLESMKGEACEIRGTVELARLARMLPATLHIRPGTVLRSGSAEYQLSGGPEGKGGHSWIAKVEATNLAGSENGRSISLTQPISLDVEASESSDVFSVQRLTFRSSFLRAHAEGSFAEGQATLRGDMQQLVAQLSQFLDLGSIKAEGDLSAQVAWDRDPANLVKLKGKLVAERFALLAPRQLPWREDNLTVTFSLDAATEDSSIGSLERGQLSLRSGEDQLDAELTAPVDWRTQNASWPVQIRAAGELASWLARVQPVFRPAGWQLAGIAQIQTTGRFSPTVIELDKANLEVRQLQVAGPSVNIREPKIQVEATGTWDANTHRFTSRATTFASSALAFRASNVLVQTDAAGVALGGQIGFRSDLARIADWVRDSRTATTRFDGAASGDVELSHRGDVSTAQLSATIENPAVAQADGAGGWQPLWADKVVQLVGKGTYSNRDDAIAIQKLELGTDQSLRLAATGSIAEPAGDCRVDLKGQVSYDLELLVEKLRSYFGDTLRLAGRDTQSFVVRGPLWPERAQETPARRADTPQFTATSRSKGPLVHSELVAASGLTWEQANFQGLVAGPGELKSKIEQGVLSVQPLDLAVGEGRLTINPRIELNAGPPLLVLEQGPLVQNVRISPEICQAWLKYLAPLLADVTEVEGRFSVDLDRALLPLDHPKTGTVKGQLAVHKARVGPSPLSQQFLWIAKQVQSIAAGNPLNLAAPVAQDWVELPEHQVAFEMIEGRVHHRQLRFQVRDVAIETSGSVGLDQTISLVAQVPIRNEWIDRNKLLSSMQGQTLQIPISGSLTRPKIDDRALRELGGQAIRGAAGRLIEDELNKGLKRLFGEPK